jgi:hypothetical protein
MRLKLFVVVSSLRSGSSVPLDRLTDFEGANLRKWILLQNKAIINFDVCLVDAM